MNLLNERSFANDANGYLFAMLIVKTSYRATDNMRIVNQLLRDIRFSKHNFIETDEDRCLFKMVLANMINNWFGNSFDTYYNGANMGIFQNPLIRNDIDLEKESLFKLDCIRCLTLVLLGQNCNYTHQKVRDHVKATIDTAHIKIVKLNGYTPQ